MSPRSHILRMAYLPRVRVPAMRARITDSCPSTTRRRGLAGDLRASYRRYRRQPLLATELPAFGAPPFLKNASDSGDRFLFTSLSLAPFRMYINEIPDEASLCARLIRVRRQG